MKRLVSIALCLVAIACHAQTFSIDTISDAVFLRMQGKSYKKECTVARSELRYLRLSHYDKEGREHVGELVCNKQIANDLKEIFQELYKHKYPIGRMQLIDDFDTDDERSMKANNTSCFNFRSIAGSSKLSKHFTGMAIDINPLYKPYVKQRKDGTLFVQPATADKYGDRQKAWPYKIERGARATVCSLGTASAEAMPGPARRTTSTSGADRRACPRRGLPNKPNGL